MAETLANSTPFPSTIKKIDQTKSIHNHAEFIEKNLDDPGDTVIETKVYTWRLRKFSGLPEYLYSPEFECGGHPWNILLYPSRNEEDRPEGPWISLYLCHGSEWPASRAIRLDFALAVSNAFDPTIWKVYQTQHDFYSAGRRTVFGWARFRSHDALRTVKKGQSRPILEDGYIDVTAFVRVLKGPVGDSSDD